MPKNPNATFAHVAGRIFDTPLLIEPREAEAIAQSFLEIINGNESDGGKIETETTHLEDRPLYDVQGETAIIRVVGLLVQRHDFMATLCGFVAYERLNTHISAALADSNVKRVVFEFDTPGGEVAGITETSALIAQLTQVKQTVAVVNDKCCSCGYWLAAQCSEIVCSPTSVVGNIGAMMMHRDYSEAEKIAGIKTTYIRFGEFKGLGNRSEPLSEAGEAHLTELVEKIGMMFVKAVAQGRGTKFSEQQAIDTQARSYTGDDAVASGLADRIGYLESTLRAPVGEYASPTDQETEMTGQNQAPATGAQQPAPGAEEAKTTATETPAASAADTVDVAKIQADARAEGAAAERKRQADILALDAAKTRPKLAAYYINETAMTAEQVKGPLAAAAEEQPAGDAGEGDGGTTDTTATSFTDRVAANEAKAKEAGTGGAPKGGNAGDGNVHALANTMKRRAGITD